MLTKTVVKQILLPDKIYITVSGDTVFSVFTHLKVSFSPRKIQCVEQYLNYTVICLIFSVPV